MLCAGWPPPPPAVAHFARVKQVNMPSEDLPNCNCGWLERATHAPECPIEFDPRLNEYHLKFARTTTYISYCPSCGGRAPQSPRAQQFVAVSDKETIRLHLLTKDLKTEEDALTRLGELTSVFEPGAVMTDPEEDDKPAEIRTYKTLHYENHSRSATINVLVGRHGKIRISFPGKYIGKPQNA